MANIVKHGKGWMARVFYQDDNGKRRSKSKGGFKTKSEAKIYAVKLEKDLIDGNPLTNCDTPLPDYFWRWYLTFKEPVISYRTKKSYEYTHHVLQKYFKSTAISDISRTIYQSFLSEYGRQHAKETVSKINVHVKACIKNAVYDEIIKRDFTTQTTIVFNKNNSRKIEYLSIKELKALTAYLLNNLDKRYTSNYMLLTAIYTGMRLGEIQGLEWHDINFNFKTISIRRAWEETGRHFKDTKNESSKRIIHISFDLIEILKTLKTTQKPKTNKQQVFINQFNTVPASTAVNKTLRAALKATDINKPSFHFHSLRHTHVAYLLANQVDLYAISKRLGHSSISTTTNTYAYLINEYKDKTDSQIDKALDKINESVSAHSLHTNIP